MSEYMVEDIVKALKKKYGIKPKVYYDFAPVNAEDIISFIENIGEAEFVSSGDGWLINLGSNLLELILVKRGVTIEFEDPRHSSVESTTGEKNG